MKQIIIILILTMFFSCEATMIEKGYVIAYDVVIENTTNIMETITIDNIDYNIEFGQSITTKHYTENGVNVKIIYKAETKIGYYQNIELYTDYYICK